MSAPRHETRVGWCPSVATPMEAHDGLLVRIKPTAATISTRAARALAEASVRFGNGAIDLTNRANLQVRGLRPDSANDFAQMAREQGLASPDGAFEEIRNVAADPLGRDDPNAAFDSHAIARAVEAMLAGDEALRALPPKFGFLVDCGRSLPLPDGRADIVVRAKGDHLAVMLDGGARGVFSAAADAPALARRLAQAFLALAGPADAPPYRMRELVADIGEDAIFAKAGLSASVLCPEDLDPRIMPDNDARENGDAVSSRDSHLDLMYAAPPQESPVGRVRFPGRDTGAIVAGVPRGRLGAALLSELAGLAERFSDGTLRLTPWRAIVFVSVTAENAAPLLAALKGLDLITDPADPRRALRGPDFTPVDIRTHRKAALP